MYTVEQGKLSLG